MPGLFEPISRPRFFSDQLVERPFRRLAPLLLPVAILIAISPPSRRGRRFVQRNDLLSRMWNWDRSQWAERSSTPKGSA